MENKKEVVILGGGSGGLAVAYYLSQTKFYNITILEKEPVIGGLCASFDHQGFKLDYGAHKLYSTLPGIMDEIEKIFDGHILKLPKKNKIFLRHDLLAYPLKLSNLTKVLGFFELFKLGLGFGLQQIKNLINPKTAHSYEDYMISRFGSPAYKLVFEPLANKVWGNPAGLHLDMAKTRVPASNAMEVILKLLGIKKETANTNAEFFLYPNHAFGEFAEKMKEKIEQAGGKIITSVQIKEISMKDNQITAIKYTQKDIEQLLSCDYLVSTIPLPSFFHMLFSKEIEKLESRNLVLVYIFANRDLILNDQWIFFPEKEFIFSRIFEQKQMDPNLGPKNQTVICCDFTCDKNSNIWQSPDNKLADKCIEGLIKAGFIRKEEVKSFLVKRFDDFYPRYGLDYDKKLSAIINVLKKTNNVLLSGRSGMYNYNNCDHCLDMALFIKNKLVEQTPPPKILEELLERVKNYKIVD